MVDEDRAAAVLAVLSFCAVEEAVVLVPKRLGAAAVVVAGAEVTAPALIAAGAVVVVAGAGAAEDAGLGVPNNPPGAWAEAMAGVVAEEDVAAVDIGFVNRLPGAAVAAVVAGVDANKPGAAAVEAAGTLLAGVALPNSGLAAAGVDAVVPGAGAGLGAPPNKGLPDKAGAGELKREGVVEAVVT